jgi:hypothetical protein
VSPSFCILQEISDRPIGAEAPRIAQLRPATGPLL